ncbi:MAG TPA: UPF0262 family protein [Geminicoccus sp.]|uniref:UPF0262 family protein n=1 Tax=Geminicoccus sp. TaxID=2024832 RepID=UPI002E2F7FCB|nr:UPF0262 family protein [Geminicoccus sp.]HEX2527461.1 UPF0262 family protein [Geminicoccus sp.]
MTRRSGGPDRIVAIELDQGGVVRWTPEVQHERSVAIFDLLEDNCFRLKDGFDGPYHVFLSLRDMNLVLLVKHAEAEHKKELILAVRPLRRVIKDYFIICDSYFQAIRGAPPSRIEAIDMARRGLHNEGAELLREALVEKVDVDALTARRLFTLVCVLSLRR